MLTALQQIRFDELVKANMKKHSKLIDKLYQDFLLYGTCNFEELDEAFKKEAKQCQNT